MLTNVENISDLFPSFREYFRSTVLYSKAFGYEPEKLIDDDRHIENFIKISSKEFIQKLKERFQGANNDNTLIFLCQNYYKNLKNSPFSKVSKDGIYYNPSFPKIIAENKKNSTPQ